MRTGATQSTPTAIPDVDILVAGADAYSNLDSPNRLIHIDTDELVWGGKMDIYLDNSDGALDSLDYEGKDVAVTWGFQGVAGSTQGAFWVFQQEYISYSGKLALHLVCYDGFAFLANASGIAGGAYWNYPWQSAAEIANKSLPVSGEDLPADLQTAITAHYDKTVQNILTSTIAAGLSVASLVVTDDDGYTSTLKPQVYGSSPREVIRQALLPTKSYLLWKSDKKFYLVQPDNHASVYTYNTITSFFKETSQVEVAMPNRVIYWFVNKVDPADPTTWTWDRTDYEGGHGVDAASYARLGFYIDEHHMLDEETWEGISSQAEADSMADARIAKIALAKSTGTLEAPMHCAQELYDAITIVDNRYASPKTITGYVFGIKRVYEPGVYKITLTLGGAETGQTPASGEPVQVTTSPKPKPVPPSPWDVEIPKSIQGYHHNITFSALDYNTVQWGVSEIEFYDGTTQAIAAGNTGNMTGATTYYVYFDLDDASPNVLKVTTDYKAVMSEYTGLVCICLASASATGSPTILPSYGKEPLITPSVIYMAGLTDYDYGTGLKIPTLYTTEISSGYIKLTASSVVDAAFTSDKIGEGSTNKYDDVTASTRANNAIDASYNLKTILKGSAMTESWSNDNATGLYVCTSYLGYWDTVANTWNVYIANDGKFYFGGDTANYISWNGSTFSVLANVLQLSTDLNVYSGTSKVAVIDATGVGLFITAESGYDITIGTYSTSYDLLINAPMVVYYRVRPNAAGSTELGDTDKAWYKIHSEQYHMYPASSSTANFVINTSGVSPYNPYISFSTLEMIGTRLDVSQCSYIKLPLVAGDPGSPVNGDIWYNTSTNKFRVYENGAARDM